MRAIRSTLRPHHYLWMVSLLVGLSTGMLATPWIAPRATRSASAITPMAPPLVADKPRPKPASINAPTFPVTRVVDGDTVRVLYKDRDESVRMLRINTPERDQFGYVDATRELERLIDGRPVGLEFERTGVEERDKYNRLLAYVWVNGKNANVEMVRSGWANFYTVFGEGKYASEFRAAFAEAKSARQGLWKRGAPPPGPSAP